MISGLHSGGTSGSSEIEMEAVVQHADGVEVMDEDGPEIESVHNDWSGSYADTFLGVVSVVSMSVGAVMMVAGSVIMGDGEKEVYDEAALINRTVTDQPANMTQVVNEALNKIREGNGATAWGASVMSFGAGCGFVGLGLGAEFLRRYLCGGPPRE